jgi:UDP-N-acetylmuramate dehydrogenase
MNDTVEQLEKVVGRKISLNESLIGHSLLKLPIQAQFYVEIDAQDVLIKTVTAAKKLGIPVYILGSGARVESGKNIKGLIIKNLCRRFDKVSVKGTIKKNEIGVEYVQVYAQAGALMNQVVRFTIEEGLEGLEYQLGLPGTVGGAIYTNAKYQPKYLMVNKALQSVTLLSSATGEIQNYTGELPYFVYTNEDWTESEDVILSAVFKLKPADKKLLWERGNEAVAWRQEEAKRREEQQK